MSTKAALFQTKDNDRCYIENDAMREEGADTERCIVLEISAKHSITDYLEHNRIVIEEGTALANLMRYLLKDKTKEELEAAARGEL